MTFVDPRRDATARRSNQDSTGKDGRGVMVVRVLVRETYTHRREPEREVRMERGKDQVRNGENE